MEDLCKLSCGFDGAAAAIAGPGVSSDPDAAIDGGESHCVVWVVEEKSSGEFVVAEPVCYASFGDAMVAASEGSIDGARVRSGEALLADE